MKPTRATVNRSFPPGAFDQEAAAYEYDGEPVVVLRRYWYNGEGWCSIVRQDGTKTEIPDVFIDF